MSAQDHVEVLCVSSTYLCIHRFDLEDINKVCMVQILKDSQHWVIELFWFIRNQNFWSKTSCFSSNVITSLFDFQVTEYFKNWKININLHCVLLQCIMFIGFIISQNTFYTFFRSISQKTRSQAKKSKSLWLQEISTWF